MVRDWPRIFNPERAAHQKKTTSVPIAVPQSRAAESTSTEISHSISIPPEESHLKAREALTVVLCPPREMSFPDNIVKDEAD